MIHTYGRQWLYAALASLAILAAVAAVGLAAHDSLGSQTVRVARHHVTTRMHVTARTTPNGYGVAVIHGCTAEDACRADYHPNGAWTIRPVTGGH